MGKHGMLNLELKLLRQSCLDVAGNDLSSKRGVIDQQLKNSGCIYAFRYRFSFATRLVIHFFKWEVRINYSRRGANIHINMSIMALNHSELLCRIGVFFGEEEEGTCYVLNRSENVPCMCIAMIWKSMLLSYFLKRKGRILLGCKDIMQECLVLYIQRAVQEFCVCEIFIFWRVVVEIHTLRLLLTREKEARSPPQSV